jgi:prohibitin 2
MDMRHAAEGLDLWKLAKRGAIALAAIIGVWILWPFAVVPAGHMGVVALFGKVDPEPRKAGLAVVMPLSKVHHVNVQILKHDSNGDAASKDLQGVHTTITSNFNVIPAEAAKLYSEVGMSYEQKIFDGAVQETFKAVTAHYTAEELIKMREKVTGEITALFKEKIHHLSGGTIRIDAVFIKNFQFGAAFNKAIEEKQVAEQTALKASRDLDRIKIEADQKRAQAQGEADAVVMAAKADAESFRLKSHTLTAQMLQMAAIEKWDGKLPTYTGGGGPLPFITVK